MADRPYGFRPVQTRDGSSWTGKTYRVAFAAGDATAAYVGDLVEFTGEATANGKIPIVTASAAAATRLAGAIVRFENDADGYTSYRPASTERIAYIPMDRDVIYSVQEDSDAANLAASDVQANIDFVVGAGGNNLTGQSSYQLDSDTAAVTATLPLRLLRLEDIPNNELGANAQWLVTINQDAYNDQDGL